MKKTKFKNEIHNYDENCGVRLYKNVESNKFINLLYRKPLRSYFDKNLIGFFKYKFKERKYYKENIKPLYNELKTQSPDFNTMYEYADFIRLLERVFFYKNSYDKEYDGDKLLCESNVGVSPKIMILDLVKDDVIIAFKIYKESQTILSTSYDEVIEIRVNYNFGKKSTMNYKIVNREVDYDSIHSENLMITILERLQEAMAKLFLDYYNKI